MSNKHSGATDQRTRVLTEAERKTYVHDWIARRFKAGSIAGTGLVSTLLTLPLLAAAQAAGEFVSAAEIEGVTGVETMADGSVQLTMSNGTTISVPAADVQLAANGDVLVSERVADIAAEVMAAGGAAGISGGALAAGLGGVAAAAAIASGGGDDGGDGEDDAAPLVINSDALGASGGLSNVNTEITLPEGTDSIEVTLKDADGIEIARGEGQLGEDGAWTLPLTSEEAAQGEATVTVTSRDEEGEEIETTSQDVIIDTIAPVIEITDTGVGDDGVLNIAEQGEGINISGTTDAEDGQTVTVTLTAGETELDGGGSTEYTATVTDGAWSVDIPAGSLAGLEDGGTVTVAASVEDAAGNPEETTDSFTTDLTPPTISIDDISGDNEIGIIDTQGDLLITGTTSAEVGQPVTVTFNGVPVEGGEVTSEGVWTATVPQTVLQDVQDGAVDGLASVDVTATVSDLAGNPAETAAERTLSADFNGPSISIDDISSDNIINAAEAGENVTISGTTSNVPETQTVTVTVGDADPAVELTGPVDELGNWSVIITPAQAADAGLTDGAPVTVTADVSDGETGATVQANLSADTTAPTIAIDTVEAGGAALGPVMNIAESGADLTISGTTTDAEADQTVTVALGGETFTTTTDGTNWSLTIANDDLPDILDGTLANDGTNVTIEATVADRAGNGSNTAQSPFVTDFAPPVLDVDALAIGDSLNIAEAAGEVAVTGTVSGHDDNPVTVSVGGVDAIATVEANGDWTATFASNALNGLDEGEAAFTVSTQDDAGNTTSVDSDGFAVDLTVPTVEITEVSAGDTLTLDEFADGLTISGTASADAVGNDVTVSINGTDFATPVEAEGDWSITLTQRQVNDLSLPDESNITVDATVADAAGNPSAATAASSAVLTTDFKPTVSFDEIGVDGAVDLAGADTPTIGGTTLGVEDGREVTVTFSGTQAAIATQTATVTGGIWTLPDAQSVIDALEPGETFSVEAAVSNDAGRAADPATESVDAYLAAVFAVANTAAAGTTLSMSALAADGFDSDEGVQTVMTFDTGSATYVTGSDDDNLDLFIVNADNAASGSVTFSGGTISGLLPEGEVTYSFDMEDQGAGPITLSFDEENQGGPTELQIGSSGVDTLTAASTDSVIQAKGDNDSIDVSATGENTIIFEPDQAANGTDDVTGFTTGDTFQSDVIAFLGAADLRGDGDTVEALGTGGALGANTGFVIFTTALANTDAATVETALEGLTGEAPGDVFYALAGDGADAALVLATFTGTDDATIERLADFNGIGDLGDLRPENVVLPDPATLPV